MIFGIPFDLRQLKYNLSENHAIAYEYIALIILKIMKMR